MKEVITIISRKGGTGKTTTAQAISGGIRSNGGRVLLIDLDAQRNLSMSMNAKPTGYNITHLLEGTATAADAVQHTPNGDIITGSAFLAGADLALTSDTELKKAIEPLLSEYDYIIIDTPASYGKLTRNALTASTAVLITSQAASYSAQGLADVVGLVNQIQTVNKGLHLKGVIITNYTGRSNHVKRKLEEIKEEARRLGTEVLEPPIRATDKVTEAQEARANLKDFAPNCTASKCYDEITEQVLNW